MKKPKRPTIRERARAWAHSSNMDTYDFIIIHLAYIAGYRAAQRDKRKGQKRCRS